MYVFSHRALLWRGSEFTSHRLSYAVGSRYSLSCPFSWEKLCMLYVHQPVIRFVMRVRTAFVFVNKYTIIFLSVLLRHFWHISDLRLLVQPWPNKEVAGLPFPCLCMRAAWSGRLVCTLCCMQTQFCVWGLDNFLCFWWSQIIASECAKILWGVCERAGPSLGCCVFLLRCTAWWVRQDIYRMLGGLISWIFAQQELRHV